MAVLSVVLCHADLGLPGGFVGVDVFFVISGYLITALVRGELLDGSFSFAGFWTRRARRILPALVVVTAASLAAGWALLLPVDYVSLARSTRALALLVSNVHFMGDTGYFAQSAEGKPLLHTWSLAVEEQFYVVAPLALWLLSRMREERTGVLVLLLAFMASFAASVVGTEHFPVASFYTMPTRAWELLLGVLLAHIPVAPAAPRPALRNLVAVVGALGILVPAFVYDARTSFPGLAALPPVAGTAMIVWAGSDAARAPWVNILLALRPVVLVGLVSYSVYLWHWPLLAFARYRTILPLPIGERLAVVAASLALGAASWRWVETPFRTRRVLTTPRQVAVASALAFGAVLLGATVISCAGGFPRRLSPLALRYAAAAVPDPRYIHELAPQDIPARMVHYGPPAAPVALLVWGDSYAMAALPAIEDLCAKRGVHAVAATRSSTPPIVGFSTAVEGPRRREDIGFNDAVLRHVREEGIGSVLLVGNWSRYVDERETRSRLAGTIDDVRQAGARAYVMREIPGFPFEVPRALVRYTLGGRDPAELALPAADRERAERLHASLSAELGAHGAVIVDPVPYLRAGGDPGRILPFDEEGALFRDAGHLSTHGAIRIAPAFESMFDAIARR